MRRIILEGEPMGDAMLILAESAPIWPAIWSAIAATCSGIAAIVLMRIHLLNREDSVRPEVLIEGCSFSTGIPEGWDLDPRAEEHGRIGITRLRNEGRGPALHISATLKGIGVMPIGRSASLFGMFIEPITFLGVGKSIDIDWKGYFPWKIS